MTRSIDSFVYPMDSSATPYNLSDFSAEVYEQCQNEVGAQGDSGIAGVAIEQVTAPVKNRLRIAKCIVVGDIAVGKTCLINKFGYDIFDGDYKSTIGVDFDVQKFEILKRPFSLQIWDTAGQDRFRQITRSYYRGAHAALIVFDMANMASFRNVYEWLKEILDTVASGAEKPFLFLVGTKKDLLTNDTIEFFKTEGAKMANQIEAEFWMVSASQGENVFELFNRVASLCFNRQMCHEVKIREEQEKQAQMRQSDNDHKSSVRYSARNGGAIFLPAICRNRVGSKVDGGQSETKSKAVATTGASDSNRAGITSLLTKHLFTSRLLKMFHRTRSGTGSKRNTSTVAPTTERVVDSRTAENNNNNSSTENKKRKKKTFHCFSLTCTVSVDE